MCTFGVGDGIGRSEKHIGKATTDQECATLVSTQESDANGATYHPDSGSCFAEFGAAGSNSDPFWRTCLFGG